MLLLKHIWTPQDHTWHFIGLIICVYHMWRHHLICREEKKWQTDWKRNRNNSNQTKTMLELHPNMIHPWLLGMGLRVVDKYLTWGGIVEASCLPGTKLTAKHRMSTKCLESHWRHMTHKSRLTRLGITHKWHSHFFVWPGGGRGNTHELCCCIFGAQTENYSRELEF